MRVKEFTDYSALVLAGEVHAAAVEGITVVNSKINAVANGPRERPLDYALDGRFGGVPFVMRDLRSYPQEVPNRDGYTPKWHGYGELR